MKSMSLYRTLLLQRPASQDGQGALVPVVPWCLTPFCPLSTPLLTSLTAPGLPILGLPVEFSAVPFRLPA